MTVGTVMTKHKSNESSPGVYPSQCCHLLMELRRRRLKPWKVSLDRGSKKKTRQMELTAETAHRTRSKTIYRTMTK